MVVLFLIFEEPPSCCPQWLYQLTSVPKCPNFLLSTASPILVSTIFDKSHSNIYEMISHSSFDISYPDYYVGHLFMYLLAIFINILAKYLQFLCSLKKKIGLFGLFLLMSCISVSYILNINPLSDRQFENMLSHSIGCCCFLVLFFFFAVKKLFSLLISLFVSLYFLAVKKKKKSVTKEYQKAFFLFSSRS